MMRTIKDAMVCTFIMNKKAQIKNKNHNAELWILIHKEQKNKVLYLTLTQDL